VLSAAALCSAARLREIELGAGGAGSVLCQGRSRPCHTEWGNIITAARLEMAREPMVRESLAGAFLPMSVAVLCANLLADAVRDAFDPPCAGAAGDIAQSFGGGVILSTC
jgi:ABC-type dipeptide/oligopeptide/nickel transport system permease subunit